MFAHDDEPQLDPGALPENLTMQQIQDMTFFEYVPVHRMFVPRYGRALNVRTVNSIRGKFNPLMLGVLMLSLRSSGERAGEYALIDGQHRKEAASQEGYSVLPARVFIDLTYEQEAALYIAFATVHKQGPMDRFRARLESREPAALELRRIVQARGMDLALHGHGVGRIQAIDALEKIYVINGPGFTRHIVSLLHDAWNTQPRAWIVPVLTGTAMFWARYHDEPKFDRERLIEQMKLVGPEEMLSRAGMVKKIIKRPISAWGQALLTAYNKGLRSNQLPEWEQFKVSDTTNAARRVKIAQHIQDRKARGEDVWAAAKAAPRVEHLSKTQEEHEAVRRAALDRKSARARLKRQQQREEQEQRRLRAE